MLEIEVTNSFLKKFKKLPKRIQHLTDQKTAIFRSAPEYPALHVEKLTPKNLGLWSFRINRQYRVIFRFTKSNTVLFINVGSHDIY